VESGVFSLFWDPCTTPLGLGLYWEAGCIQPNRHDAQRSKSDVAGPEGEWIDQNRRR
jgi:hypothetical protein